MKDYQMTFNSFTLSQLQSLPEIYMVLRREHSHKDIFEYFEKEARALHHSQSFHMTFMALATAVNRCISKVAASSKVVSLCLLTHEEGLERIFTTDVPGRRVYVTDKNKSDKLVNERGVPVADVCVMPLGFSNFIIVLNNTQDIVDFKDFYKGFITEGEVALFQENILSALIAKDASFTVFSDLATVN